ncbi:hypothetical protein LKL35_07385 [Streptomyces sp. ET3-23]|uniref:hypothetical protein n=1 Tax=Streptomyces sp. ET3-23 TaxID=2885643 RepID=UPI001D11B504|nr:hypothetical protein [Streptomyces sp. ET3-23]MCC2275247.1 hypothetical protein [Streptomyces sp. ET3-23]
MTLIPDRDGVCRVLEARAHPLRRLDLMLEAFWDAGYDRKTCRSAYELPETHVVLARLIDRMRKDGELVLLPATRWRQLLGTAFQPQRIAHGHRGSYWYATAAQYARWRRTAEGQQARIAAITARLAAAGLPPRLHVSEQSTDGCHLDWAAGRLGAPTGTDSISPRGARSLLRARTELLANAPADLAFLLSLVQGEHSPPRRYEPWRPVRAAGS